MKLIRSCLCVLVLAAGSTATACSADPGVEVFSLDETEGIRGYSDISKTRTSKLEEKGGVKVVDQTTRKKQTQLRVTAAGKKDGEETVSLFGARLTYATLFSHEEDDLYNGFYRLTAKLDTDGLGRLNATGGYHLPGIGSEVLLSYRLLYAKIRAQLPITGAYDERGLENALAVRYTHYFEALLKAVSANVFMASVNGDTIRNITETDTPDWWSRTVTRVGYGDVDTQSASIDVALGSEGWGSTLVQGVRLDLGGGYEEVRYGAMPPFPENTDSGFTGFVTATAVTPAGLWTVEYHGGQAADVGSIEWQLGQMGVFWRDVNYAVGSDETIIGLSLSGTFEDLAKPAEFVRTFFSRPVRLFRNDPAGYDDIRTTGQYSPLENDQFIAKPRVIEIVESSAAVNRNGLPDDVRLDTDNGSLIVSTRCSVAGIASVSPNDAADAFSYDQDEVQVDLAGLPATEQTVTVRVRQQCSGTTDIYVHTGSEGEVALVRTRENRGTPAEEADVPPAQEPPAQAPPAQDPFNQGP